MSRDDEHRSEQSNPSPVIGTADSIFNESVGEAICAHVKSLGGEVWGKPIPVGDKWHAVVAITFAGPLVLAEFGVTMGEKREPKVTMETKEKEKGKTP